MEREKERGREGEGEGVKLGERVRVTEGSRVRE